MAGEFNGKVVIVTGGSSGIGQATAMRFAAEGAKVVVAARSIPEGEGVVRHIVKAGGEALFVRTDVAKATEVAALIDQTVASFGGLDYAVNNAGSRGVGRTHELSEASWDEAVDTNLKGTWLCMKYAIIHMLTQGRGVIVNMASTFGLVGFPNRGSYAASKHGVIGLTKTAGGCFKGVDLPSDGPSKLVAIDKEPNHQIVHTLRFRETDRPTHQPLDPGPQIDVLAFDFLCVFLANRVLIGLHMTLVGTPAVGIIARDAKRF